MGGGSWSNDSYKNLQRDYSTKTRDQVFTSRNLDKDMDPKDLKFRESRDSDAHPESVAVMVFLDETGSMGSIPEVLIKEKLGALMNTLISHGVPHAHVLFGGIGDHYSDNSPIQVGQFEAGTAELDQWLTKIYLEGGGGGQNKESYLLAWLIGGRHTSIDCFEKRAEKGFLFTIGDEGTHTEIEAARLKDLLGYAATEDVTAEQLLKEAQRMYHVFHLLVLQGSAGRQSDVHAQWKGLLGERVIMIEDYNTIAEIIASTVAVVRGADIHHVTKDFDHLVAGKVTTALSRITSDVSANKKDGIVKL